MAARKATADWSGGLKDGGGTLSLGSGAVTDQKYTFRMRFEDEPGTNPEELIGAAHSSCFTMFLSGVLEKGGTPAESLETTAHVHLRVGDSGPSIPRIELKVTGRVPGIDDAGFQDAVQQAKEGCPVSKALAAVDEIDVEATLED